MERGEGSFEVIMDRPAFPSPMILRCLGEKKVEIINFDSKKADVYAVGMVLLSCCHLTDGQQYYDYSAFKMNDELIEQHLRQGMRRYSYPFLFVLECMLKDPDAVRPSATDLKDMVRERLTPAGRLPFVGSSSRRQLALGE